MFFKDILWVWCMGVEKGAAEPSNYALSLQSMAVPQPNSVFLSLCLKIPRHTLDMSLKNFCFFCLFV